MNGTELAKALDVKPGPWMKDALDVILAWQLRNPTVTNTADAIEEVKKSSESELPSRLIYHFLTLTIRPLFSQIKTGDLGDAPALWKTRENKSFLDLLQWCIRSADEKDIREWFGLLRPPIFRMLEDSDLGWNAKACQVITQLVTKAPDNVKEECRGLFAEDLFGYLNYLPTLTPAQDSARLLEHVYPALMSFIPRAEERCAEQKVSSMEPPTLSDKESRFLDKIVRQGVVAVLHHMPAPTTYPELTTVVLRNLIHLINIQEIEWIKHANDVLPSLHHTLRDKLSPAHPELPVTAARCLQTCISKGWPRMGEFSSLISLMSFVKIESDHHNPDAKRLQDIYLSFATAWVNCSEYENDPDNMEKLRSQLRVSAVYLENAFTSDGVCGNGARWWTSEKDRAKKEDAVWVDMLALCRE